MSDETVNNSEAFVLKICQRSILSPWCYNNPQGKDGDELCDVLVVCDPHVIIISVKEIMLKDDQNPASFERWQRKAIDASIRQIFGAERWLALQPHVIRKDGTPGWKLPALSDRKVHRIAVAFGGRGEVPISSGDDGKGYVHVMTEDGVTQILQELDTITDLVEYLEATEDCFKRGCGIISSSESDLLGWYLFNGRKFPPEADMIMVNDSIWDEVRKKPEFVRRKEADRASYTWDRLIEILADPTAKVIGEASIEPSNLELALRTMARESRFSRRHLGGGVSGFLELAKAAKVRARILRGLTGTIYVLVYFNHPEDDKYRISELGARCLIARHNVGEGNTIVGIAISKHIPGKGSASDMIYIKLDKWTEDDDRKAAKAKQELGFFKAPIVHKSHEDEFPTE